MPLIPLLIQLLLPVAVEEVKKKIAARDSNSYQTARDVPTHEAAVPALQAVMAGAVTSKMGWFSLALVVLGFFEQNQHLLSQFVPTDKLGYVVSAIGALTFFLRAVTTTSLVEKAEPKE